MQAPVRGLRVPAKCRKREINGHAEVKGLQVRTLSARGALEAQPTWLPPAPCILFAAAAGSAPSQDGLIAVSLERIVRITASLPGAFLPKAGL